MPKNQLCNLKWESLVRKRICRSAIFLLLFAGLLSVSIILLTGRNPVALASGGICFVDGTQDNGISYTTIQAAIDDGNCLTVHVASGTYAENLVISRSVTLSGVGADSTILDGQERDRVVKILAGTVNLSGMTIRKGYSFEPGFTSKGGAGLYNLGTLTVTESIIENNQVFGFDVAGGGGIYNGHEMTLIKTIVRNNFSTIRGGGIDNEGTIALVDSEITNNVSEGSAGPLGGGGIHTHPGSYTLLSSSVVISNTGVSNPGGGIYSSGRLVLRNTAIRNNTANSYSGGGIYSQGELSIDHSYIAENVSHGQGGGIRASGPVTITNSMIVNNAADTEGGGIYVYTDPGGITVWIYRNQVVGNTVKTNVTSGVGGGIFLSFGYGALSAVVVDSNFVQNNAAFFCGGATLEGRGISWTNNIVSGNQGGGICTQGGANPGESWLINNTVMFNAGNGIEVNNPGDLVVHLANNILANNQQFGFSYRVFDGSFSGATLSHNAFWENGSGNVETPTGHPIIGSSGNVAAPPLLVDPANGDWHLSAASPLIDSGLNEQAPPFDFEGNTRPFGAIVDIGADEFSDADPNLVLLLTMVIRRE
jgi:predicted outer membrane repeat protein